MVDRGREAYDRARSSVSNMASAGTSGSSSATTPASGTTGGSNVGGSYGA